MLNLKRSLCTFHNKIYDQGKNYTNMEKISRVRRLKMVFFVKNNLTIKPIVLWCIIKTVYINDW